MYSSLTFLYTIKVVVLTVFRHIPAYQSFHMSSIGITINYTNTCFEEYFIRMYICPSSLLQIL